jgi:hypothetical protein
MNSKASAIAKEIVNWVKRCTNKQQSEKSSLLLITREIQIKIITRHHHTTLRMVVIRKIKITSAHRK